MTASTSTLSSDTTVVRNGFRTSWEDPPLECSAANLAPFSLPQEVLVYEPDPGDVVCQFTNGDRERKIHVNIELEDAEKASLKDLQKEAKRTGKVFYPSITVMATRYLSRARGDVKKAIKLMEATQAWRSSYFGAGPVTDAQVLEDLKLGIVYFTGRDKSLRPAIIVRPMRIPSQWYKDKCIDRFIRILIFCMEYMLRYMLLPGRVENLNLIVDLKGLGITQVPIAALTDVYKVMSHHYVGRAYRFYIVNMGGVLSYLASPVKSLMTDRQRQKICIVDKVADLRQDFALHHLEEDLGGSKPPVTSFFPFPVQAGPFEAGCAKGPDACAFPNAHRCLSEEAAQGHLWDTKKNRKDNLAVSYSEEAYDIFVGCNYAVPSCCPVPQRIRDAQEAEEAARRAAEIACEAPAVGSEAKLCQGEGREASASASTGLSDRDDLQVLGPVDPTADKAISGRTELGQADLQGPGALQSLYVDPGDVPEEGSSDSEASVVPRPRPWICAQASDFNRASAELDSTSMTPFGRSIWCCRC